LVFIWWFSSGGFQISIIYSGLAAHGDKAMDKPGYVITTDTVVQLLNPACHHQIMVGTLMVGTSWLGQARQTAICVRECGGGVSCYLIAETFHRRARLPRLLGIFNEQNRQPRHRASPFLGFSTCIGMRASHLHEPRAIKLFTGFKGIERTIWLRFYFHS
jgi:hypothetical protein